MIDLRRPIGRVYAADGSVIDNVTHVVVIRRADGTIKSMYPVADNYRLANYSGV